MLQDSCLIWWRGSVIQYFFLSSSVTACSICCRASKPCSEYKILLLSMGSLRALVLAHRFPANNKWIWGALHWAWVHSFFPAVAQENKAEIAKCRLTLGGCPFFLACFICLFFFPSGQVEKCLIISEVKLIKLVGLWHMCSWDLWCLRCSAGKTNVELAATSEGFVLPDSSSIALELWAGRDRI